jgi:hypothetical protein
MLCLIIEQKKRLFHNELLKNQVMQSKNSLYRRNKMKKEHIHILLEQKTEKNL